MNIEIGHSNNYELVDYLVDNLVPFSISDGNIFITDRDYTLNLKMTIESIVEDNDVSFVYDE